MLPPPLAPIIASVAKISDVLMGSPLGSPFNAFQSAAYQFLKPLQDNASRRSLVTGGSNNGPHSSHRRSLAATGQKLNPIFTCITYNPDNCPQPGTVLAGAYGLINDTETGKTVRSLYSSDSNMQCPCRVGTPRLFYMFDITM